MNELFSFCDDHFKIFILIWLKLREYYFEAKDKPISIPFIISKTSNFLKKIRQQCKKIYRFKKVAKFVHFLELELAESEQFIEKLQHFALIADIFELPEPFASIIKNIGVNSEDGLENNLFSKKINDIFKNIDDVDLEKKIDIIEDSIQEEGTLINFLKKKSEKEPEPIIIKDTPKPVYNTPMQAFKSTNISRIPRIGATPNPRTIYRKH
jgi:hypothetical protein